MQPVIQSHNLNFSYTSEPILKNLNLTVPMGSIYGFLGQNGSGKTTTIRLLLGLLKVKDESIKVLNYSVNKQRLEILNQVGALIENPSLYDHLTAYENLNYVCKVRHIDVQNIEVVLKTVHLEKTKSKKIKEFSLGMKQRLGLAIALLHKPSLLILDEPTNGLDPQGIIDMRELLQQLNSEQKMSIFLSSHILSEIEKIASQIGIIHNGELKFQGSLSELKQSMSKSSRIHFEISDIKKSLDLLKYYSISIINDTTFSIINKSNSEISQLNTLLIQNNIDVYRIYEPVYSLEEQFLDTIREE